MLAFALFHLLFAQQPLGMSDAHKLRITVAGTGDPAFFHAAIDWYRHQPSYYGGEGVAPTYHNRADLWLAPGIYDICAFADDYRKQCVVIRMPDHDAHMNMKLTELLPSDKLPEPEPGLN